MKKVLIAALIAGFSLSATAAETIRFATEASYPPFESIDANNQIVGFDVDLAQALCKEIDATCTFSNQAFDSLIPSLKFRRVEAVMAGMDITPEREKQVTISISPKPPLTKRFAICVVTLAWCFSNTTCGRI